MISKKKPLRTRVSYSPIEYMIRVMVVLLIAALAFLAFLLMCSVQQVNASYDDDVLILMVLLVLVPFAVMIGLSLFSVGRTGYWLLISFLLVLLIGIGILCYYDHVWYSLACFIAVVLCGFFIFYHLPLSILGGIIALQLIAVIIFIIPTLVVLLMSQENGIDGQRLVHNENRSIVVCGILFFKMALLIAIGYIPRQVEWSRYFFPARSSPLIMVDLEDEEKGFTLIELLITVALIGILMGGTFHVWSNLLRTQKEVELRAHAAEILSSQMNAIMALPDLPDKSSGSYPLLLPMTEFVTPYSMEGTYRIERFEADTLVKITVHLIYSTDVSEERNFRLVAYRAAGGGG